MRTKKLRLVSALLALAMLFVMMPVGAFADYGIKTSGNCGANGDEVTWEVKENGDKIKDMKAMTLTISGKGAMADYKNSNDLPWIWWAQEITQIVIKDGVTRIGNKAFYEYGETKIDLPDSVISIGDQAFYYCTSLQEVKLSPKLTEIGVSAFEGCNALENIEIPAGVKTIGDEAFLSCISLGSVTNMNGVTNIGAYAFCGCENLESIDIPNSVTNIGAYAFSDCKNLGSVTNMNGVTNIGEGAFARCKSLRNVTIPSGVTSIEDGTFLGCMSLGKITIPSGVTTIGDVAFALCAALKEITIPQQVEKVGEGAFMACAQLEKIDIESDSNLTTVGKHAFETNCMYQGDQLTMNSLQLKEFIADVYEIIIPQFAETKIYCGAPLKKSGKLSGKGVAEENIIASVTVKLVDGEQTKTWNVPYGGTYGETVGTLEKPTKEGYTFVGWYDEKGNVFDPAAPLTEDTTIHAEWKKNAAPAPTPTPAPAPVDDDSVDAGAVAATVVLGAGTAALAYHIGTEVYAEQVLGKGVVVPTLRGDVARKAWELAGKPAVTVAGNEAPDEDAQAQQWVVDQGLMKDRKDGKFHPEQWMSKLKALRTLDAAKKLG